MGNQLVENGDKGSSKSLFLMPEAPKLIWAQRATGKTRPKAVDLLVSTKGRRPGPNCPFFNIVQTGGGQGKGGAGSNPCSKIDVADFV